MAGGKEDVRRRGALLVSRSSAGGRARSTTSASASWSRSRSRSPASATRKAATRRWLLDELRSVKAAAADGKISKEEVQAIARRRGEDDPASPAARCSLPILPAATR
jgi:hypothetical protein